MTSLLRLVIVLIYAVWQGGFVFYGAVVVPIGADVLESDMTQGFITQRVTNWLNVIGTVSLAVWSVDLWWTTTRRRLRSSLWAVLVTTLITQFVLHQQMDDKLDAVAQSVLDPDGFYALHRRYLIVSTLQWLIGCGLLLTTLHNWQRTIPTSESRGEMRDVLASFSDD